MNLARLRTVDYWLGIPLCAGVSLWHALIGRWCRRPAATVERIALIELTEAGSTVLAYTAMKELARRHPRAQLYWVIFSSHVEGLEMLGVLPRENIVAIRTGSLVQFAMDCLRAVLRLRRLGVDTAVDMELFCRFTAALAYATRAGRVIGFHAGRNEGLYRGSFLTHKVFYNAYSHVAHNYLALVEAVGQPVACEVPAVKRRLDDLALGVPDYRPPEPLQARAREILAGVFADFRAGETPLALISSHGGALPLRAWPLANYEALVHRMLAHDPRLRIGIVGLPVAAEEAEELIRRVGSDRLRSFVGRTRSLRELVALYWHARVLVTSDGGPGQFAVLSPMATIVLFGPETPLLYRPLGPRVTPLFAHLCCSPCFSAFNHRNSSCTDNRCLQAITVDQVWAVVAKELATPPTA